MNFIMSNLPAIFLIITGILGVAAAIAKLTPSTKDDAVVAKAEAVVETVEKILPAAPVAPKA